MGPCQIIFLISPSSPKQTRKLKTTERSSHRTRCEHPCLFPIRPIIHGLTNGVGKLCLLQLTLARHITDKSTNTARGNGLAWKKKKVVAHLICQTTGFFFRYFQTWALTGLCPATLSPKNSYLFSCISYDVDIQVCTLDGNTSKYRLQEAYYSKQLLRVFA